MEVGQTVLEFFEAVRQISQVEAVPRTDEMQSRDNDFTNLKGSFERLVYQFERIEGIQGRFGSSDEAKACWKIAHDILIRLERQELVAEGILTTHAQPTRQTKGLLAEGEIKVLERRLRDILERLKSMEQIQAITRQGVLLSNSHCLLYLSLFCQMLTMMAVLVVGTIQICRTHLLAFVQKVSFPMRLAACLTLQTVHDKRSMNHPPV